jgi:hypothetical protein
MHRLYSINEVTPVGRITGMQFDFNNVLTSYELNSIQWFSVEEFENMILNEEN